jgi:membrane dipeptidase
VRVPTESIIRAGTILQTAPVVDGHNDLPWELRQQFAGDLSRVDLRSHVPTTRTDLTRLRAGGVGAQFWSVYVPGSLTGEAAVAMTLEQIDLVRRMVADYSDQLELAYGADDVRRIVADGRVASLLGAEGGQSIACSLAVLRMLHLLGVRYLTLTHNFHVPWADSATDEPRLGGLSAFGREVVREMNRLGMLVDLSHVSAGTMSDALDVSAAPVVFSHSSSRRLVDHPRNVPDDVLARLPVNGGLCMVTFVPSFVSAACRAWDARVADLIRARGQDPREPEARVATAREIERTQPRPVATVEQVADHVEHVREVAGVEHVGIGGDFDGSELMPAGLSDVSCYPTLVAELLDRGWSDADCALLSGGNAVRVLAEAEVAAARLQGERGPSTVQIEDIDEVTDATSRPSS